MKVRTGFVTNSSSYSVAEIRIDNPVLLEILQKYKNSDAFEGVWLGFGVGLEYGKKQIALQREESESFEVLGAPKRLKDVLASIIEVMDLSIESRNPAFNDMIKEMKRRKTEIDANFRLVYWQVCDESYGEFENQGKWTFSYKEGGKESYKTDKSGFD